MKYLLTSLVSLVWLLHSGQSRPSYTDGYSDYSSAGYGSSYGSEVKYAPVGYHGPLANPVVLKSGFIADTPEVAAAKHQHYSALQKAKSNAATHGYSGEGYDGSSGHGGGIGSYGLGDGYGSSYGYGSYGSSYGSGAKYAPVGYHGPLAKTVVLKDGHIADTPEVAAAKHQHYSALQKAKSNAATHGYSGEGYDGSSGYSGGYGSYGSGAGYGSSYGYGSYGSSYGSGAKYAPVGYHGPLAKTVVLKDGHIADTPEVTAAKHLHYSAIQKAKATAAAHGHSGQGYEGYYGNGGGYGDSYGSGVGYESYGSGGYGSSYGPEGYASSYKYAGPLAYPKVLPSGLLADTHEVAAAKHAHLNAVAITANEHADKWANNYFH